MAATQCLGTINVILFACESAPDMYPNFEKLVGPILDKLLCEEGMEYFEDILETIACLSWFPKVISDFTWSLLPRMLKAVNDWAGDFIPNIVPPLTNYIAKDLDHFLKITNPNVFIATMNICKRFFEDKDEAREAECTHCCRIIETFIAYGHGKLDKFIPEILKMVSNKAISAHTIGLKLLALDIVAELVHYNPVLFLNILKQAGDPFTRELFNHWLSSIEHMEKFKQRKMCVLGLASLTKAPISLQPKELQLAFPKVLTAIMAVLHDIRESKGDDSDVEQIDEEVEEMANLDDDADAEDELQSVTKFTKNMQKQMSGMNEGGLIADDDFQEPYEKIDEFVYWASSMQELSRIEPAFYQKYMASLNQEEKEGVQKHLEVAKDRQAKINEKNEKKSKESNSSSSSSRSSSTRGSSDEMSS